MIYMDAKLIQIAEKQAQIINELTRNLPLINLPSGVMESLRIQNKLAKQFIDSVPPYLKNFSQISKNFDELQNIKNSFVFCSETIRLISKNLQKYDFSQFQNLEENRKFLDDIERINPELYKEILKVYGDKPFHKLTQFINKCRSLPEDEQYDFICDHINYHPEFFADANNDISIIKSKKFSDDLNNVLSSTDINNKDKIINDIKALCKKYNLSNSHQININLTVNINKPNKPSLLEDIKRQLIYWVIFGVLTKILFFIWFLIKSSLIPQEPLTGEIVVEQIRQTQGQTETQSIDRQMTLTQNSNIELESQGLQQSHQTPKTITPEFDDKSLHK